MTLGLEMSERVLFPDLVKLVQEGDFENFNDIMNRQNWSQVNHRERNGVSFRFIKASLFMPSKQTIIQYLSHV